MAGPNLSEGSEIWNLPIFKKIDAVCIADHWLWVPNGSLVSASKAWSEFNLVAEGILGLDRRCNKNSPILCDW